ncbi:ABC transporter ATP-binding protein [Klenkia sp. LSe6-5]|uniref:ABC transporter ATP-binding protein n=1 Tax=Klenkia sesuvii TaxID=3103137 RepID=A0ABU8E0N6_9ACTN
MTELLSVDQIHKVYGSGDQAHTALESVSFDVRHGEIVCVVGPSGCGKTTLLRCISGLSTPTTGIARLRGEPVTEPPAGLGFVFQDYSRSLYPWWSVAANVAFPLRGRLPQREIEVRVDRAVEAVGLAQARDRKPFQLSGGMQQRVAIARAIAYEPDVMLMDEPFASVDAQTRAELEDVVRNLRSEFDMTILFITHDIDESVYLADRVVVLTPSPTTVREIVEIPLGAERDQIKTKELDEFVHLRGHIYRAVKNR